MVKTALKWTAAGLVLLALACTAYFALLAGVGGGGAATVLGYSGAVVTSGSMGGTLEVDDLIVTRRRSAYAVGDVVTYQTEDGSLVTHRIVKEGDKGFTTQGDANNAPDLAPVAPANILGEVVLRVPRVGGFISAIRTPVGLALLLGCAVVLLALILWPTPKQEVSADETLAAQ